MKLTFSQAFILYYFHSLLFYEIYYQSCKIYLLEHCQLSYPFNPLYYYHKYNSIPFKKAYIHYVLPFSCHKTVNSTVCQLCLFKTPPFILLFHFLLLPLKNFDSHHLNKGPTLFQRVHNIDHFLHKEKSMLLYTLVNLLITLNFCNKIQSTSFHMVTCWK